MSPKKRKPVIDFLKNCRLEYDQLIESSPTIDDSIIKEFKYNFSNASLKKPDICNGLDICEIYEPTKEEKAAELMSNIGIKMKEKEVNKKSKNKWNRLSNNIENINNIKDHPKFDYSNMNNSKKELENLATIGRVSNLKKTIIETNTNNPVDQINELSEILNSNDIVDNLKVEEDIVEEDIVEEDIVEEDIVEEDIVEEDKVEEDKVDDDKVVEDKVEGDKVDDDIEKGLNNI
jgi:hypothetical protein